MKGTVQWSAGQSWAAFLLQWNSNSGPCDPKSGALFTRQPGRFWTYFYPFNPSLAEHDMPCLSKQCKSRSVGFFRSQLIWTCTICQTVCEFIAIVRIKQSDWLKIRSGCGILIYSAWQGLFVCVEVLRPSQPNGVMSSAVSLPNHTFTGQA